MINFAPNFLEIDLCQTETSAARIGSSSAWGLQSKSVCSTHFPGLNSLTLRLDQVANEAANCLVQEGFFVLDMRFSK